jgi:hypothetical protein
MPTAGFYFTCLYGLITGVTGALLTTLTQLSGTTEPIATNTWLVIVATGLSSAAISGKAAWKTTP